MSISALEGCSIYYTSNGSTPTTSSVKYTEPFIAEKGTVIKAIAVNGNDHLPATAEIILPDSLTVTLNDHENHTWTYYSGVDTGDYNTAYAGKLYSPDPRDVKITYLGGGITLATGETGNAKAAVGIDASETAFVYQKTLEKKENKYPYTTISNPFSKRPSRKAAGSQKQFYGFNGWKVVSIKGGNIANYAVGSTIPAEKEINFQFTGEYTPNCTSAEVVLEAIWAPAKITYLSSVITQDERNSYEFKIENNLTAGVTTSHENNFLIIDDIYPGTITVSSPCNIMMVEPDGSADYRELYKLTGNVVPISDAGKRTKIEYTRWHSKSNIDALGRNFTIGRGMNTNGVALYGTNQLAPVDQILKVESGKFSSFAHYANNVNYEQGAIKKQWVTLGCDYDRAKNDNSKLEITGRMYVGHYCMLNLSNTVEMCRVYGLSGKFMTNVGLGSADWQECYYMSVSDNYNWGHRYLEIQGGEWPSITGGTDHYDPYNGGLIYVDNDKNSPAFTFRMKGGHIRGSVYGAAAFYDAVGTRTFIITGGTINGWVAGGANGTRATGGAMLGASYVYVGGNAKVDSRERIDNINSNVVINRAVGGNVFGAGCGYNTTSSSGQVTEGTNVVIADNAYVERGVYGGGSYGYCPDGKTSNIFITGGTMGGNVGGVNGAQYDPNIKGGIFGGACQNNGGNVNMYMTGGTVYGGIYGGSNASGTISGNINMNIHGGTVGASDKATNIHGGGYGSATAVNGNVSLTLGKNGAEEGTTVYGDVYGGSALGVVNNAVSNKTEVTFNGGNINGSLYGGGLGDSGNAATVKGNVTVTTNGGIVIGAIYGCNNVNGAPQGTVTVNMNGGDANYVYGGGNLAAYTYNGNYPVVNVRGGTIRYALYGGGLGETAIVTGNPQVLMTGGTVGSTETVDDKKIVHGDIFGGGNAAAVNGSTNVAITGGEVKRNVYGGGNQAIVSGATNVVIGQGK